MEKIIIKNFGPIKDVELEIKDINVFIGSTSSGKSTVAKLIAISREFEFLQTSNLEVLTDKLSHYNIDFDIDEDTYLNYRKGEQCWELKAKEITNNYPFRNLFYAFKDNYKKFISGVKDMGVKTHSKSEKDMHKFIALMFDLSNYEDFLKKHHADSYNEKVKRASTIAEKITKSQEEIKSGNYTSFIEALENIAELYSLIYGEVRPDKVSYVPAERILLSMVAESLFGLMNNDVTIAKCIKDFGAQFESARKQINSYVIPFLNAEYTYSDKSNFITFGDGAKVKLEQASSGLQSLIPLLLVIEATTASEQHRRNSFVVEEPELNLYPTVQKQLVEFIIERVNKSNDKLIITTHSPYVLTSLDNLIQASNAAKINPDQKSKITEIVSEEKWIDFERVACYYFEDGTCHSTLDTENQTIGASNIDDVSEELGETFDKLLEIKYAHVS